MTAILIEDLAKSYGKVVAVDGLSLSVTEGNMLGLIGPNGAGKTTTIKVILGLLRPDRGKVEVFGQNPWDNPDIRSRIGVIFEKPIFPIHNEVQDYLEKTCRIYGVPTSKAREMLGTVGLQKEAYDRLIKGLSAGMLQKFAIAHALINEPELVIADEPTSNLDPQSRTEILDLILRLHHEMKTTFFISSHILPELSRVCESIAIINNGKVRAQGGFLELCLKFGIAATRVSTDEPQKLAEAISTLRYVKLAKVDSRGISLDVPEGKRQQLYEDTIKIAKKIKVKILGIDSGTASLEELYNRAVSREKEN